MGWQDVRWGEQVIVLWVICYISFLCRRAYSVTPALRYDRVGERENEQHYRNGRWMKATLLVASPSWHVVFLPGNLPWGL